MAQAGPLTSVNSVSESLAPVFVRSDVSSGLGSYSSALQRASRQAPQYHHVNLFLLFSVACRCPRLQSPATTLSAWSSTHTHSLTHGSSVAHMTAGLLCSTSALLELQVPELIAVVNVVYHLHFNSPKLDCCNDPTSKVSDLIVCSSVVYVKITLGNAVQNLY